MNPRRIFLPRGIRQGSYFNSCLPSIFLAGWVAASVTAALPPGDPLTTWSLRTNTASMFRPFTTGEGLIVTGDDRGAIYTSANGANWYRRESGTNIIVRGVAYGNGKFVALFAVAGFSTSDDGVRWTTPTVTFDRNIDLFDVEYAQGMFIAVGYRMLAPYDATILRSTDGVAWTVQKTVTNGVYRAVTYGSGQFVAVGHGAIASTGLISTSTNGVDWLTQPPAASVTYSIAAGNGVYVGLSGLGVIRSTNGTAWSLVGGLPISNWADVSFAEGTFFAGGASGQLYTSIDGETWMQRPTGVVGLFSGAGSIGHRVVLGGTQIVQSGPFEGAPPLIIQPPASRIQRVGTTYTNSIVVESSESVTYQWLRNGLPLPGATNSTIEMPVTEEFFGAYSAVATTSSGSATSSAPAIIAIPVGISLQPVSQEVIQGGTATFSVVVTGTPPIAFRWRRGGATTNFAVLNSQTSFLTIPDAQLSGVYSVAVSNVVNAPGELSAFATLTIVPDSDHDGLPDTYETERGFNPNDPSDGLLDSDGDGVSNVMEYQAGTDPQQAGSYLKVDRVLVGTGALVEFTTAPGKTYTVQFNDDLSKDTWWRLADIPAKGSTSVEVVSDPTATTTRFYRLVTPRQP